MKNILKLAAVVLAGSFLLTGCSGPNLTHEDLYGVGAVETNSKGQYSAIVFDKEGYLKERTEYTYVRKLNNLGFSQEDVLDAEVWLAQYIVEEAVDNAGIDNEEDWNKWVSETLPKYTHGVKYEDLMGDSLQPAEELNAGFTIVGGDIALKGLPFSIRYEPSKPRVTEVSLAMEKVNGGVVEGMPNFLVFNGIVRPTYATSLGEKTVNYKFEYLVGRDDQGWKLLGGSSTVIY